jgi:hypothetical protein
VPLLGLLHGPDPATAEDPGILWLRRSLKCSKLTHLLILG